MNYSFRLAMSSVLLLVFFCIAGCGGIRQQSARNAMPSDKADVPSWITMLDDPNVNYNDAVKAFEDFWKGKVKPVQEEDMFGVTEDGEKERELEEKQQKISKNEPAAIYAHEYKRFVNWQREVVNFVQTDGSILSAEERIALWEKENELKNAQQKK